jgi:hypothetical protein
MDPEPITALRELVDAAYDQRLIHSLRRSRIVVAEQVQLLLRV